MQTLYTDQEMDKQWDELEAAWVILAEWASEKGSKVTPIRMRPGRSQGLSKASRAAIAIHMLEGLEPSEESLQGLRDIDEGRKTTEQVIMEAVERAKPFSGETKTL
jgi:hypothetical protein